RRRATVTVMATIIVPGMDARRDGRYRVETAHPTKAQLVEGGALGTAVRAVGRCRAASVSPIGMVRGTSMEGGRAITDGNTMWRPLRRSSLFYFFSAPPILLRLALYRWRIRIFDLEPMRRAARAIRRPEPFRHRTGVLEHDAAIET